MRAVLFRTLACTLIGVAALAAAQGVKTPATPTAAPAQQKSMATPAMAQHVLTTPAELTWGAPPPVFEQNAQFALLSGDPSKPGLYVVRLKMPAGYKIMPHWHPTDEHVTVLSGTFALGMGDKLDEASMKDLPVGGYALLPAHMNHYAMAKTDAIVQVHGMGPFALTYVNPNDDPSQHVAKGQ